MILSKEACCFWNICETCLPEGTVEVGHMNHVSHTLDELSFSNAAGGCP